MITIADGTVGTMHRKN